MSFDLTKLVEQSEAKPDECWVCGFYPAEHYDEERGPVCDKHKKEVKNANP